MSFELEVTVEALSCYVPNKPLGKPADAPTALTVVLPDMTATQKIKTFGKHKVDSHFPVLAVETPPTGGLGPGKFFWPIHRTELVFNFTFAAAAPGFEVIQKGQYSLGEIPYLPDIASAFSKVDPAVLTAAAAGVVATRFTCDHGSFGSGAPADKSVYFPDGGKYAKPADGKLFAIQGVWRVPGLTSCELVAKDLDKVLPDKTLVLTPAGATCRITLGNYCWDNLLPVVGGPTSYAYEADSDFAAFYRLSATAPKANSILPVPTPLAIGSSGWKCHQATMLV